MYIIPYGDRNQYLYSDDLGANIITVIAPEYPSVDKCDEPIGYALQNSLSSFNLADDLSKLSIAIAINDATRPLPYRKILEPLINFLFSKNADPEGICFYISTGTHKPLSAAELSAFLPGNIISRFKISMHDCDDQDRLILLGSTSRGTVVYINETFFHSDIKIVVGNIEPHHFMGYSGGVKTAAIGLAGRETITKNHQMLTDPHAKMGLFRSNPMRMDVEEIGKLINIHGTINVVLDADKQILAAFWGSPTEVMKAGIDFHQKYIQMDLEKHINLYDLVIASPGGYPKDINLYQAQKALTHAALFAKNGGVIILTAECREGSGNDQFEKYIRHRCSPEQVVRDFENQFFQLGPHKAYQISKQAMRNKIILVSEFDSVWLNHIFMFMTDTIQAAIGHAMNYMPVNPKIALLPYATHLLPRTADDL